MKMISGPRRLPSIDLLRGLLVALMALDHASGIILKVHRSEYWDRPLPVYADFLTFITRFSTHICAPGFFLLLGTGLVLFADSRRRAGWSGWRTARAQLLRGLLLVGLQFLVINPIWQAAQSGRAAFPGSLLQAFGPAPLYAGVLSALGMTLLAGACLVGLRKEALLVLGLLIVVAAQLLISGPAQGKAEFAAAARLLLVAGRGRHILVNYPLFPWAGVALLGMAFGKTLLASPRLARRGAWAAGLLGLALFLLLRLSGGFGNTHPPAGGFAGLLSLTKYPPSVTFLLFTLSVNLLLWRLFEALPPAAAERAVLLRCFGGAPLFFYCLHLALYTGFALLVPLQLPFWSLYPLWIASLLLFYPVCRLYLDFKRRRPPGSAWRAF
jgi:uncharacterized membrane protein